MNKHTTIVKAPLLILMMLWMVSIAGAASTETQPDHNWTIHLRSHALTRDKSDQQADSEAWAGGGWIGYQSGWRNRRWMIGATAYSAQPLYAPSDKDGTALLLTEQKSYSVLGEAYAKVKLDTHLLTAGRFIIQDFEVNPQDTRMTPRTFEGVSLAGSSKNIQYFTAAIDKMKARNWDTFEQVAQVAGAPDGINEPLLLVSLRTSPIPSLNLAASYYRLKDLLQSTYTEALWQQRLSKVSRFTFGGQWMHQQSDGAHRLTGDDFQTQSVGIRAALTVGAYTLSAHRMQTDAAAAYRTPFGSWAGYASRIITNFNRAGESVSGLDLGIDFTTYGIEGLTLHSSATIGTEAIQANSRLPLPDQQEYDMTVDYRFQQAYWPSWLNPLHLRARIGRLEQQLADAHNNTMEYHLIMNYEWRLPQ